MIKSLLKSVLKESRDLIVAGRRRTDGRTINRVARFPRSPLILQFVVVRLIQDSMLLPLLPLSVDENCWRKKNRVLSSPFIYSSYVRRVRTPFLPPASRTRKADRKSSPVTPLRLLTPEVIFNSRNSLPLPLPRLASLILPSVSLYTFAGIRKERSME